MGLPSWGELTALLIALGGGFGWAADRRTEAKKVKRLEETIVTMEKEAEKTRRSHEEAISALKAEIAEWRRQVERRDDRITALEDRLYTGGGRR